ncbi:MAG: DUF4493 domain-containing protein [Muribaculaceae bacterium]|nr:DUF4493 domain-containing protein [Muribaculaceae bacterium]
MKKIKYIIPIIASLGFVSCSVEKPFEGGHASGTGELSKYAFDIDASVMDNTRATTSQDLIDDFSIVIQKIATTPLTAASYNRYGDMPDVVTLDAGSYKAFATYGENPDAAFEKPYFLGESEVFDIVADKITTDIGDIKCKLENVKVTIDFHSSLYNVTDENAYVEVYVNKDASLKFTKDEKRAGYFKHSDVCTLTATFHGVVDGVELNEVKTLDNVSKGNEYSLTFSKHTYSEDSDEGQLSAGVNVAASVTIVNLNDKITIEEDKVLDDKERPSESDPSAGEDPGTEDPEDPEGPGTEEPENPGKIPTIEAQDPIDLDKVNEVDNSSTVVIIFTSQIGFTKFVADIESNDLTDEELKQVGLAAHLDLINPGELKDPLQGLGLLKNEEGEDVDSVLGQKIVKFDISRFMTPLSIFPGEHHFIIKVGDDNGENQCTLKLKI